MMSGPDHHIHESQEAVDNTLRLQQEGAATTFSTVNSEASFEFQHPDQMHVLYNLSSANIPPFSRADQPQIRIAGLFSSQQAAIAQGSSYFEEDDRCSLFQTQTHEWNVALPCFPWDASKHQCTETEYVQNKLKDYHKNLQDEKDTFERRMKDWVSVDALEPEPEHDVTRDDPEHELEPKPVTPSVPQDQTHCNIRFNADYKIVGQNFVVVSIIRDSNKDDTKMPLFKVYQAFDTEAEAGDYIRNCACHHVQEHDMFVAPLYTWLDLQCVDKVATVVHRENVLNKLAEGRKLEAAKIAQVKQAQES